MKARSTTLDQTKTYMGSMKPYKETVAKLPHFPPKSYIKTNNNMEGKKKMCLNN